MQTRAGHSGLTLAMTVPGHHCRKIIIGRFVPPDEADSAVAVDGSRSCILLLILPRRDPFQPPEGFVEV